MRSGGERISLRRELSLRIGGYNDRNDGFERSMFSRSKRNRSRLSKEGKVVRVKPAHRTWDDDDTLYADIHEMIGCHLAMIDSICSEVF